MSLKDKLKHLRLLDISYLPLAVTACITLGIIYVIFQQSQAILTERLRERVTAIVATASLQFSGEEISELQKLETISSEQAEQSTSLRSVIERLRKIRDANRNIRYVYIWGRTSDDNKIEFLADAEMLQPIDTDANGTIEGEEIPPEPGEDYDIENVPSFNEGFDHPTTEQNFVIDKWGTFLTGMSPIHDKNGASVAVLGVDVQIEDFFSLVRATIIPFILLAALLLLMLTIQTTALIRIWKSRVGIVKELDRQKDELLGIVSHQLANPVTAIKWNIETIADGSLVALNQEQKRALSDIQTEVSHLSELINMILDVSRIQLGKMAVNKQDLNLYSFFQELIHEQLPNAKEKNIDFQISLPIDLPTAQLDKRLMSIIFENLFTNAIKYTPNNGKISFEAKIKDDALHCIISDSGCGIPKKDQPQIFGCLFRASNVLATHKGNGFGLYAAKGAIESQEGSIRFESSEGIGTTFFLVVPLS